MQKWLLAAAAAAFAFGMTGSGSGLMAAGEGVGPPSILPPNPQVDTPPKRPEEEKPSLFNVSGTNANPDAVQKTAEVSPVFAPSPGSI